jgi:SAM-dependent methyltransferase
VKAASQWRRMVRARLAEMDELCPGRGAVGGSYWNQRGRARRFSTALDGTAAKDPLFARLRQASGRRSTVVDVGAGTGRFSLALAPRVHEVVAVDASSAMLGILRRTARQKGITNVRSIESRWEDVPLAAGTAGAVPPADVVVCSFVLPLIAEAGTFLAKMDAACTGRAFVSMNASSADAPTEHLWRHFHGQRRRPAPTYLDLAAIVADLGLQPEIEVAEVVTRVRFDTLAAAVRAYRDTLVLPDTPEVRAELRRLLSSWLVEDAGALRPPFRTMPMAIVSWAASTTR